MLSAIKQAPCELFLHLTTDLLWVYPPQKAETPSSDKQLMGIVEIECPVRVHMCAQC